MTKQEAVQVLSILKAAYPNSYKGMTKEDANGTIYIWANQFSNIPVHIVMIAIDKLISTNTFPPSIREVKEKIRGLYHEALEMLPKKHGGYALFEDDMPPEKIKLLKEIVAVTEPMRGRESNEPTLHQLLNGVGRYLDSEKPKQIERK